MLVSVTKSEEVREIVQYIGPNYKATPYIYVNVIQYGLGTDRVFTWIDRNDAGKIEGVYLLYYDCIHFYTNDIERYPVERLMEFIRNTEHRVIMLQGGIGDRIDHELPDYHSERNHINDMDNVGREDVRYRSVIARREDIGEIVDLLMVDPEYSSVYDQDMLTEQLYDRYDSGFSRYFVIKMDGKVTAACSTYGEVPGLALVGGVIVHPEYRRRGLAADVESYACHVLEKEGISRVAFVNFLNTASLALHAKIGARSIAVMAKFVKKQV